MSTSDTSGGATAADGAEPAAAPETAAPETATPETAPPKAAATGSEVPEAEAETPPPAERVFLAVVDDSPEFTGALRFASRRAARTAGRVALLYVIERAHLEQWMAVGELMREEARKQAEQVIRHHAATCKEISGKMPILHIREGRVADELLALLGEEPQISVLVLGADAGGKGPGPLVSYLVGKAAGKLQVPVTIVPGGLTDAQIDALT